MTKILNSLRVTGTGSSSQALGVTGGYVNINGNLSVGTWNPSSGTNFYILSGSSSTNPMIIRNNSNSNDIFKVFDTGAVEINNSQTGTSLVTLTLGSTSSVNGVGVLQIGSTNSGLRIVGDNNFPSFLSSNGDFVFNNSLNTTLNYNSLWFDIGTGSSQIPMISTNTNSARSLRLASGGGAFYLSTNIQSSGPNYITTDRLIIPGGSLNSPFVNPRFVNTGTLQIENVGISTRNIGTTTSNSFPNTFIIGSSQSSINISGTTYGIPTSWSQGSIIIAPGNAINMTASHFPVSGLTHTNNSNILMVAQLSVIPTGNYNVMIGGGSRITTGFQNVGIGNAQNSTNPALGELTTGAQNVAVGSNAMGKLTTGNYNTALGDRSLNSSGSVNFSNNVGVGIQSGQNVVSGNNIFIGANAGRSYNGTGDSVLYLSSHTFTATNPTEAAAVHYSSTYSSWVGLPPSWATLNTYGNVVIFGNESSGSRESSTINSTGTFRSLFFGKGMWHQSQSLNTYVISTSLPTLNSWTSSGVTYSHNDAFGSSLELVAAPGRGGGTAGDIYFSTGQFATAGTNILQNKVNRMTIKGGNGFIGIGNGTFSNNPTTLLHIYSTQSNAFRLQDGTQGVGKVLVSDANGNASWGTSSSGTGTITGSGTSNYIPRFSSSTGLTISNIYQGSTLGAILIGYTSSSSTYDSDTNVLRVKGDVYFDNVGTSKKFYLNGTYLFDDIKGSIALGYQALNSGGTAGNQNIAIGYQSLKNSDGNTDYNIGLGYQSLFNNTGDSNLAIGYQSLFNNTIGSYNLSIGYNSLHNNISGNYNVAIGFNSGSGFLVGNGNYFLTSTSSSIGITQGNFNTYLGYNIVSSTSSSNTHNTVIGANTIIGAGITNSIILSNGSGQQRIIVNATGSVIIPDLATSSTPRPMYALSDGRLTDNSYTNVRLLDSFSGSSFSDKLIDAGLNASGGTVVDCTAYSGNQTLNSTVFIRNSVKFVFGAINITFGSTNSNAHMFWINSDGVSISGSSRSTRSSQLLPTATTFTMTTTGATQAGYHIYNGLTYSGITSYNVINLKGFDCIGTASVYTGAGGGSGGTVSYSSYGVGGICIVEGDTFATGGGINVNQVVIEDILVDGSRDHGVLIIGAILAQVRNTRVSSAGGHGFYIGGGAVGSPAGLNAGGSTSTILLNCYASSGRLAGFALDGASYCQLQNCASEYFGMGYFFRSCFNVSVFGCGAESNQTQANIPKNLGIKFTNSSATASTLDDVGSDYVTRYTGTSYFISGGRNIYMPNPYSKDPGNNPGSGTASSATIAHITVYGSARSVYIPNPRTTGDSPTMYAIRVETDNTNAPRDVNILYNPADDRPTYSAPFTVYNSIPNISYNEVSSPRNPTAVILDQGLNTEIKNGTTFYSSSMLIGTASGNATASAIFQLDSTTRGVLVPRMTTSQVLAISNPSDGLTVYNTTLQTLCFYRGVAATWSAATYISM